MNGRLVLEGPLRVIVMFWLDEWAAGVGGTTQGHCYMFWLGEWVAGVGGATQSYCYVLAR